MADNELNGKEGIWIFLFFDMLVFTLLFLVFMSERTGHIQLYNSSQEKLNAVLGVTNTLVLLTSSIFVVGAVTAARNQMAKKLKLQLLLALCCGGIFCIIKGAEYAEKFSAGINPVSNTFFSFYFFITIAHLLHVIVGMIFLYFFMRNSRQCQTSSTYTANLLSAGMFWHYVDLLWIFIFPLLYLI